MSWEKVALGDLYDVHNGLSKPAAFFGHGEPFLTFRDVFNNFFLPSTLGGLVDSTDKERASYSIRRGDVFVTRTSETYDELGMSSVALVDYRYATYNGFTKRLRPKDGSLLPEFIGYYLRSREFRSLFQQFAQMTTRASLKNDELLSLRVPVPPLPVQHRIAGVLSAYDKLIENNRKQIKLLEEAARRLYKEWFVDLHFPGYETTPIVDGLPEGWRHGEIRNMVGTIESGSRPKGGIDKAMLVGVPSIGAENVIGLGQYNFDSEKLIPKEFFDSMRRGVISDRDIMVYKDGAYTGRVGFTQSGFPHSIAAVNEHVFLVRCADGNAQYWLLFTLLQQSYYQMMQALSANSAQPGINQESFLGLPALIPAASSYERFSQVVEPIIEKLCLIANQSRFLREARDRLLPKLMSGEIEV